ncbi:MAG: hypothetical protein ABW034_04340 [Steroidobacteraceae bacterium]
MIHQAGTGASRSRAPMRSGVLLALCAVFVTACGAGGGGDKVAIGDGQSSDPVVLDFPVFYVKRPVPTQQMANQLDARRLRRFEIGADLYMRDRASPSAAEVNLTGEITQGLGDVRDVEVSFDGTKVVFAMRAQFIEGADEEDQPTWNIWQYDITARELRSVIADDTVAEEGHDIAPHYLPDGRIVFSSTRQRQSRAVLTDEGKAPFSGQDEDNREPAFVLHVMRDDGSELRQISFNQSHDRDPAVLANGQIVFSRWDNASGNNEFNLYRMNPDGRGIELLYGKHSHATGTDNAIIQFLDPRPMPDGRTLVIARPFTGTEEGGDLLVIDTERFVGNTQPTLANATMTGPAQERALPTDVRTTTGPSPGGRYRSAFPLFDGTNRFLVSWSQCRLMEDTRIVPCTSDGLDDPDAVEAPTLYGVYVYDANNDTQQPVVPPQEGFTFTDVAAATPRALPPVILDGAPTLDQDLIANNLGVLHIRSVYDIDGVDRAPGGLTAASNPSVTTWAQHPARFLRIEKAISQPDDDLKEVPNTAFGPLGRGIGMREIVGYAPVEPDGSVRVAVPANVALAVSFLDANGRRISTGVNASPRHANWLQVTPGEVRECSGCHNPNTNPPTAHGRSGLFQTVNAGAPAEQAFPGTNPSMVALTGETMAQTRNRLLCAGGACLPSLNLIFDDIWAASPGSATASFDYCYSTGPTDVPSSSADPSLRHTCATSLTTAAPTTSACERTYGSLCRIKIHYETHIHPLWGATRIDVNQDSMPDFGNDGMGSPIDMKCTNCHTTTAANVTQEPAGQLDLTDGPSNEEPDQFNAYRQLLVAHRVRRLNAMGQLEEVCLARDPDTQVCTQFEEVSASMNAGAGAAGSLFFNVFAPGGSHAGRLSPAELRLLSEWLDIGAQYYNDPFAVPEN